MRTRKKTEEEKDESFSFAVEDIEGYYENNEGDTGDEAEKSLLKDEAPVIRRIRSKYTNGIRMLEIIAGLIEIASKYSLKIHSLSNDISDYRKHKGAYSTIYHHLKPMFGSWATTKIEKLETNYEKIIKIYSDKPSEKHYRILRIIAKKYEEKVHHAMMISKVSFEIERLGSGPVARSKIMS